MERIEALEEAIQKQNLVGIYSVFYTIAHGDPAFSSGKFEEALAYVKGKHINGFLQEFDGDEFEPEENWDEEYWAFLASTLIDNFCEARIAHLKQVGQKVYPARRTVMKTHEERSTDNVHTVQKRHPHISEKQKERVRQKNNQKQAERVESKKDRLFDRIRNRIPGGKR